MSFKDPNDYVRAMREMNGERVLTGLRHPLALWSLTRPLLCRFCREVRGQPAHQAEEEHVEGPQHRCGAQKTEGEEETGPQIGWVWGCHQHTSLSFCSHLFVLPQ